MDRHFNRSGECIFAGVPAGTQIQLSHSGRKSGDVASTAAESDEVVIGVRGPRDHFACKGWCGVKQVSGWLAGRELDLGRFDPDHMQGHRRTLGIRPCADGVVDRCKLRRRVERKVDHGPDVHAIVVLQSERCQYLIRADGSGRWPAMRLKGDLPLGGTTPTLISPALIEWVQSHAGGPLNGVTNSVTEMTPGSLATVGTGRLAYTMAS